jgi:hypothetical protein
MSRLSDPVRHQLWNDRIARFQQSRLTVAEFCRVEAIPVSCFYQWKKKLAGPQQQADLATPEFLPVRIKTAPMATMPVIKLRGGISIELPADIHRRQLSELLAACIDAAASHQLQESGR